MDPALAKEVEMLAGARAINAAIDRGDSEVQQFYKDTTILISGGTGFMGKQLIEKLFRSCDVKKMFLLMRPKKANTIQERLKSLLEDPVFDSVKKMRPNFDKKLCPVFGDVADISLGINAEDYAAIIAETDVIIHAAATVRFDEPLKVAVNTNTRGTVEMLRLAKQCKKLKSFVYVSTAYAHATYSRFNKAVDEKFYEPALQPQVAIDMVSTIDEQRINNITPELIQNWPNTYSFTKAIAEEAVRQSSTELPISIVRPAIVISAFHEPTPGWLDMSCAFGPSGFIFGVGLGVMHTWLSSPNIRIDLIPVDLANNAVILAEEMMDNFLLLRIKYGTPRKVYYMFVQETQYRMAYIFLNWLWHYIPGYIIDFILLLMGKKPMAVKLYTKVEKHGTVFSYFTTHEWLFADKNLVEMFSSLNKTDREIYNCDISTVNNTDLLTLWILGVRKYIIKDGLQNTEYAKKKQFWFRILHYTVVAPLYFYLLTKIAMMILTLLFYCWNFFNEGISFLFFLIFSLVAE